VQQWFALAAVATLPFAYALTLDLRFPFKLYELALLLCGAAVCADGRLRAAPGVWRILRPLAAFVGFVAVVLAIRIARPLATVEEGDFLVRFGPAGDGAAKLLYLLLAICGFVACSFAAYRDQRLYARAWIAGAFVAAAYTWFLFVTSALSLPPLLLPGMDRPQYVAVAGRLFIRSGTFQEGNYLGLYLVCSVAVALHARRIVSAALLSATTVITFSTVNVIALMLLWLGVAWGAATRRRDAAGRAAAVLTLVAVAAGGLVALATTGYVAEIVFKKLGAEDSVSKLERLDQAVAGLRMGAEHPVAGVGLSQFGYHYKTYALTGITAASSEAKIIANNVYVELLSETGLVGTLLFAAFLFAVYRRTRTPELRALRWGLLATLLSFNAFPAYTILFLWAYWALIVAARAALDEAQAAA
jgi:O-antigen ligase